METNTLLGEGSVSVFRNFAAKIEQYTGLSATVSTTLKPVNRYIM